MENREKSLFALGMTCMAGLMVAALGLHWLITPEHVEASDMTVALTWLQIGVGVGVAIVTWRRAAHA